MESTLRIAKDPMIKKEKIKCSRGLWTLESRGPKGQEDPVGAMSE